MKYTPQTMAKALVKAHGRDHALTIAQKYSQEFFVANGGGYEKNPSWGWWKACLAHMKGVHE